MANISPLGPTRHYSDVSSSSKTSPIGIKLLCIVGVLSSLQIVFNTVSILDSGGLQTIVGGVLLLGAVVQIIGFYGLWTLRFWGWVIVLVSFLLGVVISVVTINGLGAIIQSLLAYYVYSKHEHYL